MDENNINANESCSSEYASASPGVYEAPVAQSESNVLAVVALICGIVSIACGCWHVGVIPAIAAIICGVVGRAKCPNVSMAKWGMVLGIIGVAIFILGFIITILAPFWGGLGIVSLFVISEMGY